MWYTFEIKEFVKTKGILHDEITGWVLKCKQPQ